MGEVKVPKRFRTVCYLYPPSHEMNGWVVKDNDGSEVEQTTICNEWGVHSEMALNN